MTVLKQTERDFSHRIAGQYEAVEACTRFIQTSADPALNDMRIQLQRLAVKAMLRAWAVAEKTK